MSTDIAPEGMRANKKSQLSGIFYVPGGTIMVLHNRWTPNPVG